jgi:hypothetical protein
MAQCSPAPKQNHHLERVIYALALPVDKPKNTITIQIALYYKDICIKLIEGDPHGNPTQSQGN